MTDKEFLKIAAKLRDIKTERVRIKDENDKAIRPFQAKIDDYKKLFASRNNPLASQDEKYRSRLLTEEKRRREALQATVEGEITKRGLGDSPAAVVLRKSAEAESVMPSVEGVTFKRSPATFDVVDWNVLPSYYVLRELDTKAIRSALKAGAEIPGIAIVQKRALSISPLKE